MFCSHAALRLVCISLLISVAAVIAFAQTSTFNYTGKLNDTSSPASGTYQMQFALFREDGVQVGATIENTSVSVINGVFTVQLDFGYAATPGADRFLEIRVRRNSTEAYVTLMPRQRITSVPYAIRTKSAEGADNAMALNGVSSSQFVQTDDARLSDARAPLPGNANYVQNSTTQQSGTNFNISGNGVLGGSISAVTVDAVTQYNLAGNRLISVAGTNNMFIGIGSGTNITSGQGNMFAGPNSGLTVTTGSQNTLFGIDAGKGSGLSNPATANSFFGYRAGTSSRRGQNSFFGNEAGADNTIGEANTFVGSNAGTFNIGGGYNTYIGTEAGYFVDSGNWNTYVGRRAGYNGGSHSNTTLIGSDTNVSGSNLSYATAIGAGAVVSSSNTIVLGRSNASDRVVMPGIGGGGTIQICRNAAFELSFCSSSIRYKTNVASYGSGMTVIDQLKPISYNWRDGGMEDLGFAAEDVARIDPRLATYNNRGEVEGIKYDRLSAVFVNAIKEQQKQIEAQQKQIDDLKKLVNSLRPKTTKKRGIK